MGNKKLKIFLLILSICSLLACARRKLAPDIGSDLSYPVSVASVDSSHFLLLNSSANGDYENGSIHSYLLNANGSYQLQKVTKIPTHGADLAVSPDGKLVALSFDASKSDTKMEFYQWSGAIGSSELSAISNLSLDFSAAGGQQSIKRLKFFTPQTASNTELDPSSYYFYGVILSYAQSDGSGIGIPGRLFVAQLKKDFSSSRILFYLSYGLSDPNSLAPKSDSLNAYVTSVQYLFGFNAPSFYTDGSGHNYILAMPSGSVGGFNSGMNTYPPLPDPFLYLSGQPGGNTFTACSVPPCIQPDMRAVSLAAVDMNQIIAGDPLNNSTYFVPLAWNKNGIPYGAPTNSGGDGTIPITYPENTNNGDASSFHFQSSFWTSHWLNMPSNGNQNQSCFANHATTSANQFSLNDVGAHALLIAKSGNNGKDDSNGFGNEIFQLSGLDILSNNINTIRQTRGAVNIKGETDFKEIAAMQVIDLFHTYASTLSSTWLLNSVTNVRNPGPVVPYMYARTTGVPGFDSSASAIYSFGVLNFGANQCRPYWVRDSYLGSGLGTDSAWLGANPTVIAQGAHATYQNAVVDPTQPVNYSFLTASGARVCTELNVVASTPQIFCVNFLNNGFSQFHVTSATPVFTPF